MCMPLWKKGRQQKESKHIKPGEERERKIDKVRKEREQPFFFLPPVTKRILLPTTTNTTHILKDHKTLKYNKSGHTNKYKCAKRQTRIHTQTHTQTHPLTN